VLEANLDVPRYNLSNYGMTLVSVVPSTAAPYARNEIRLILAFSRTLKLVDISEIRIESGAGWDFRPLCNRYKDATGGCSTRCAAQLPYSEVRGHHLCPQPNLLILLLDQSRRLLAGTYTLHIGALNPAAAPTRNLWSVALLSLAANLGWTPETAEATYADGIRPGQRELTIARTFGFDIGLRLARNTPPPLPLKGEIFEVMTSSVARPSFLFALLKVRALEVLVSFAI